MKVLNIEKTQGANGILWDVTLAKKDGLPSKVHLVEREEPDYGVDDDVPVVMIKPPDGSPWYYKRTGGSGQATKPATPKTDKPSFGKSHEEQESIKRQSARRDATRLYCHSVEAGVPFNRTTFEEIFGIMLIIGDAIVSEAVKLGGRTKQT